MSESSNSNPQKLPDYFLKHLESDYKNPKKKPKSRVEAWIYRWIIGEDINYIRVNTFQAVAQHIGISEGNFKNVLSILESEESIIVNFKLRIIFQSEKVFEIKNKQYDLIYDLRLINNINILERLINRSYCKFLKSKTIYFSKDGGIEVTGRDEMMSKVKSTFADPEIVKVYQEFENLHWKYKHRRVHVKRDHKANETTAKYILQLCSEYNQFNSRKGMNPITPKRFIEFVFLNWYPFNNGVPIYFSMLTADSIKKLWSYAIGDFPLAMSDSKRDWEADLKRQIRHRGLTGKESKKERLKFLNEQRIDKLEKEIKFNRQQFMNARGYMSDEEWQYCLSEMKCTEKQYYEFLADGSGMYKISYSKVFPERVGKVVDG